MLTDSAARHLTALDALRRAQCDVLTRAQLRLLGVDSDAVRAQINARRWRAIGTRVVVLHCGPLSTPQQHWVAVLSQPPGAALAGITAAAVDGLRWLAPEPIHVVIAHGARPARFPGVVVHVSRRFSPDDVHPRGGAPRTSVARSVVDAASWAATDRRACGVLCAAVQQRLTTAAALRVELSRAGLVDRHRLIRLTLGDIEGGSHSFEELGFLGLARQAGLPTPKRQTFRFDSEGDRRYLDVDFRVFRVEIQGPLHQEAGQHAADLQRFNRLTLVGERVLYFSTITIRVAPQDVLADLRRACDLWL